MSHFSNPFSAFITAVTSGGGDATIHGPAHERLGSIHTMGHTQFLHDEIGRNSAPLST